MPNSEYAEREYWNARFVDEKEYEWLCDYNVLKEVMNEMVMKENRVVHVGCGNSTLSQDMFDDGFTGETIGNMEK